MMRCRNPLCTTEFEPKRSWQRYCSPECRIVGWQQKHILPLPQGPKPTRREAWLLVLGWKVDRVEWSGAVKRVWWRDPVSGEVFPQAEALEVEEGRI